MTMVNDHVVKGCRLPTATRLDLFSQLLAVSIDRFLWIFERLAVQRPTEKECIHAWHATRAGGLISSETSATSPAVLLLLKLILRIKRNRLADVRRWKAESTAEVEANFLVFMERMRCGVSLPVVVHSKVQRHANAKGITME